MYMTDDMLVKVSSEAMVNSLKISCDVENWALRKVLYKHGRKGMIERPQKRFSVPLADWLRGQLREWAKALLNEPRLQAEGYFYPAPIRKAWLQHVSGKRDNASSLWSVLMFQAWLEEQGRL